MSERVDDDFERNSNALSRIAATFPDGNVPASHVTRIILATLMSAEDGIPLTDMLEGYASEREKPSPETRGDGSEL